VVNGFRDEGTIGSIVFSKKIDNRFGSDRSSGARSSGPKRHRTKLSMTSRRIVLEPDQRAVKEIQGRSRKRSGVNLVTVFESDQGALRGQGIRDEQIQHLRRRHRGNPIIVLESDRAAEVGSRYPKTG
jgi:hypothetical protein